MRGTLRPIWMVFAAICGLLLCAAAVAADGPGRDGTVKAVRVWSGPDSTRVVFELSAPVDYKLFQLSSPDRVVLDLDNGRFADDLGLHSPAGVVKDLRIGHYHGKARMVLDLNGGAHPKSFLLSPAGQYGYRLVVDLYPPHGDHQAGIVRTIDDDIAHGKPRPVVIAVDAGHGGDDPGARGPNGELEKNVTLAIARDLARQIDAQPGMQAVLTRSGDYFVPLDKRFQIAREHKADLFVSIHANSCPDFCDARGGSVWVLSTHGKQGEAARWLANSENKSDLIGGVSLDDKSRMLASVLLDLSQGASMHAAREVGGDVLSALGKVEPLYRDSVQGANFVVLRSPDVPSILVETAFISNHSDEHMLGNPHDRKELAGAILAGVQHYFENTPPPGTWFAAVRDGRLHPGSTDPGTLASQADHDTQVVADGTRVAVARTTDSRKPVAPAPAEQASADADVRDMHRVARGETLSGIAQQYGVSMKALRSINPRKISQDGGVQAGQVLLIPST
jgi:N-acetylmuramoyl-L-alanine amidase